MTNEETVKLLDDHVARLREHFDSVQILVTWVDEQGRGTRHCARGGGDWFARLGMARSFVERDHAIETAQEIAQALRPGNE